MPTRNEIISEALDRLKGQFNLKLTAVAEMDLIGTVNRIYNRGGAELLNAVVLRILENEVRKPANMMACLLTHSRAIRSEGVADPDQRQEEKPVENNPKILDWHSRLSRAWAGKLQNPNSRLARTDYPAVVECFREAVADPRVFHISEMVEIQVRSWIEAYDNASEDKKVLAFRAAMGGDPKRI